MTKTDNAVAGSPAFPASPADARGHHTPARGCAIPHRRASARSAIGRRILTAWLGALFCTGCQQHWPEPGEGGMVEARWPGAIATTPAPASLADRLHCTLGRLDALREAAARTGRYTGKIALLDITATRAKREYAGRLFDDSRITLADLDAGIDDVLRDMVPSIAALPVCT